MGACSSKQKKIRRGASSTVAGTKACEHVSRKSVDSSGHCPAGTNLEEKNTSSAISALEKVYSDLVDCIEPDPVLDQLLKLGFPPETIMNIREMQSRTSKNRKLLEEVRKRGNQEYHNLKSSLALSGQKLICTLLKRTENGENTSDLQRKLRDKDYEEFKEELIRFYMENESMISASPLVQEHVVPLMELYVQPPMSVFIKPNAFGQENVPVEKKRIFSYREFFITDDNALHKNIYVEANAGFGKTSFTQHLAMTWCRAQSSNNFFMKNFKQEDVDAVKSFDLLFLLHLIDFQDEETCLLDDLISKFVARNLPEKEHFSTKFIVRMLQNKTCLVIIDGLDEWVHPKACTRTPGIPHNNYRENCTVLTTTRPWKLSTIGLLPHMIDRHVELSELDEETSEELKSNASKLLSEQSGENKLDLTDFNRKTESVNLGNIRLYPYILLQLVSIWFDGLNIGNSKCETYSNIIEITIDRGLNKKNVTTRPTGNVYDNVKVPDCMRRNALCTRYVDLLFKLGNLAFKTLFRQIKESSKVTESSTVLKYLTEHELEFCLKIGLLSQTKDRSKVSVKRFKVFFQHVSVLEFMAALYISSDMNNATTLLTILQVCSSLSSILEMENVFVFVCGMNPNVYGCISRELQKIVDLDSVTRRYVCRTDMCSDNDRIIIESIQSMQVRCLKESMRNGNESWPIPLYVVIERFLSEDLKSILNFNKGHVKSLIISDLDEEIEEFFQSLDPGLFTSMETLRLEVRYKEPVWLANILTESARTMKCLTLSLGSLSNSSITALTGLSCLQSLYLYPVYMTHSNLKCLYAYISQTTTLTQLMLKDNFCWDHKYGDCDETLDLHRLNELKMLYLDKVPCTESQVNPAYLQELAFQPMKVKMTTRDSAAFWKDLRGAPVLSSLRLWKVSSCLEMIQTIPTLIRLKYLWLAGIDMGNFITCLSPAMTELERIELHDVNMSSDAWRKMFLSVGQLPQSITVRLWDITMASQEWGDILLSISRQPQSITVELDSCKGQSRDQWKTFVNVIKSTPSLSLIQDLSFWMGYASLTLRKDGRTVQAHDKQREEVYELDNPPCRFYESDSNDGNEYHKNSYGTRDGFVFNSCKKYHFIDTNGHVEMVKDVKAKALVADGVCIIKGPKGQGTGFRVGERFIMTAAHVIGGFSPIKGLIRDETCYAEFGFFHQTSHTKKIYFKEVVYRNEAMDVAVIELQFDNLSDLPPAFKTFCPPVYDRPFFLIGHPLGKQMEINTVDKTINIEVEVNENYFSKLIQESIKVTGEHYDSRAQWNLIKSGNFYFQCKFAHGASGSPGFILIGTDVYVTTMLLSGLPWWYYEDKYEHFKASWSESDCVEQGLNMELLYSDMQQYNPKLCQEIFGGSHHLLQKGNIQCRENIFKP